MVIFKKKISFVFLNLNFGFAIWPITEMDTSDLSFYQQKRKHQMQFSAKHFNYKIIVSIQVFTQWLPVYGPLICSPL